MTQELSIDLNRTVDFLVGLLNTPSPTGYYVEAIEYVREQFERLNYEGLETSVSTKGVLLIKVPGESPDAPVALTAHLDTLGFMVKEIKPNGRLALTALGGILWAAVESEGVTVRTYQDRRIRGSIVLSNTSTHVNRKAHTSRRNEDTMEVRLDEVTNSAAATRDLGIEVGDFVFVDPRIEMSESGFIRSRFLDDKAGVACMLGAVVALQEAGLKPPQDVYLHVANYEEVGHGGTSGLPGNLAELLTVDMGAIGRGQSSDEFSVSICAKDVSGPYHFDMVNKLRRLAETNNIPHHIDIYLYYASDGSAYWRSGGTAKVGLAGPGIDGSHAYERTHRDSILHSTHLLARYMLDKG